MLCMFLFFFFSGRRFFLGGSCVGEALPAVIHDSSSDERNGRSGNTADKCKRLPSLLETS